MAQVETFNLSWEFEGSPNQLRLSLHEEAAIAMARGMNETEGFSEVKLEKFEQATASVSFD